MLHHDGCGELRVGPVSELAQALCQLLVRAFDGVHVPEGSRRRHMTEPFLEVGQRRPRGRRERLPGVPQVVKGDLDADLPRAVTNARYTVIPRIGWPERVTKNRSAPAHSVMCATRKGRRCGGKATARRPACVFGSLSYVRELSNSSTRFYRTRTTPATRSTSAVSSPQISPRRRPHHAASSHWGDQAHDARESRVSLHTRMSLVDRIIERTDREHLYKVPCVMATTMTVGSPAYVQWIIDATAPAASG